jgi:endogenous inhibitor of DNA gyrase (YacG/DUF329 family)
MKNSSVKKIKCPTCKKNVQKDSNLFFPFCSERCKMIELGAWLDDKYVIEGSDASPSPDDEEPV